MLGVDDDHSVSTGGGSATGVVETRERRKRGSKAIKLLGIENDELFGSPSGGSATKAAEHSRAVETRERRKRGSKAVKLLGIDGHDNFGSLPTEWNEIKGSVMKATEHSRAVETRERRKRESKVIKLLGIDGHDDFDSLPTEWPESGGSAKTSAEHSRAVEMRDHPKRVSNKASKLLGMEDDDDFGSLPTKWSAEHSSSGSGVVVGSLPLGGSAHSSPADRRLSLPPVTSRRVSFVPSDDKARKILGMDSPYGVGGIGLPTTSETSEASSGSGTRTGSALRRTQRYTTKNGESFGDSSLGEDESVVTFEGSIDFSAGGKKKKFRATRKVASKLTKSIRRPTEPPRAPPSLVQFSAQAGPGQTMKVGGRAERGMRNSMFSAQAGPGGRGRHMDPALPQAMKAGGVGEGVTRNSMMWGLSTKWNNGGGARKVLSQSDGSADSYFEDEALEEHDNITPLKPETRKSMTSRRENIDVNSLTMGLDLESANFLDWMTNAKCQEWLKSLSQRDPRFCIKAFFDDVARDGADNIEQEGGFQPELLSPLLSMFQRSSVFSVWRPTSVDSIRKMMKAEGTGKGLDIKGKSAKKGKLSAYVPFLQIHDEAHKTKIRTLPRDGRIRIFYKKRDPRDNAHKILLEVVGDMTEKATAALKSLLESKKVQEERGNMAQDDDVVGHILALFPSLSVKEGIFSEEEQRQIKVVNNWSMDNPSILVIDDYSPKCYGLDLPKRLFWEAYVMRAKDISRTPGSVYDTGRPSRAPFQDMNFTSIKNEPEEDSPRAVVWQYTDPYLPPTEPDPDPMMPQTLLMAYEEHGRVMPVVSDFDCFLLGTRGVRFHNPLPEDQVELVHSMLSDIEKILDDCREGKSKNWTASWLDVMKKQKKHNPMPKYGFGDPKSYAIMKYAVHRLEEFGAVRHGAECFNFSFPQELDDEFLVIGGNLDGAKYKYMGLKELQDFLSGCIDLGFTFPLNPKWVLCDEGWKALWDKLTGSTHPNVQLSINAWYPPGSQLKERIEEISAKNPDGFQSDLSGRKKGTQAWDEAMIALDRYQRIQRAKLKLWVVLVWISLGQQSRKRVQARISGSEKEGKETPGELNRCERQGLSNRKERPAGEKWVSYTDQDRKGGIALSVTSEHSVESNQVAESPATERIVTANTPGLDRPSTGSERYRRLPSLGSDSDENANLVDSLLNSNLPLSEYQTLGLQRLREQLAGQTQMLLSHPRINNRFEHRHTSINERLESLMLEDAPSFILKEYGGASRSYKHGTAKQHFHDQVKKIMCAQRLTSVAKSAKWPNGKDQFLPVEWTTLRLESKQALAEKLSFEALSRWDYNIIEVATLCNGAPLLFVGWAIIGSPHAQQAMANDLGMGAGAETEAGGYNFATEFSVQMPILCSFLRTVEADYLPNPYHNNLHAADVLQTLNTMLQLGGKEYASSTLDIFSILVAAAIHDVKHPGLNNNYQVNSRSELAVQYNDVSVLENYSITWFFSKLLGQTWDFTVDILSGLTNEQFSKARSIIVKSVLATDMTHHFALLKKMGIHQEMLKGKPVEEWLRSYTNEGVNYDPSTDMMCFLLHQADISNPAKPYPLFEEWADRILEESYAQGEREASLSLPVSPLCDRETTDKKQSQIGFIKFVVHPSYQLLGKSIPLFAKTVFPHIDYSLEFWENYGKDKMNMA